MTNRKTTQRFQSLNDMGDALSRVPQAQINEFGRLIRQADKIKALFARLRAMNWPQGVSHRTFYPDCNWQPAGSSFRAKKAEADTVCIFASVGKEFFYLWLEETGACRPFLLDDERPGVEPEAFDEVLKRLAEILEPSTGFIKPDGTEPNEPTFRARYQAWNKATREAGTR